MDDQKVDTRIGRWLLEVRVARGMSQEDIIEQMPEPLSIQELDEYERGKKAITISQLYQIGEILRVPTAYFLECCAKSNR